jgi:hypothetical protein
MRAYCYTAPNMKELVAWLQSEGALS